MSPRRVQDRDKPRPERGQPEEEAQWQKKIQEDDKQKREELPKKKESEDKGKQEMQEKLSKLFQPHQELNKPGQAPWSNAGRAQQQGMLWDSSALFSLPISQRGVQGCTVSVVKVNNAWIELWTPNMVLLGITVLPKGWCSTEGRAQL